MARHSDRPSRRATLVATFTVVALVAGVLLVRLTLGGGAAEDRTSAPTSPHGADVTGAAGPTAEAAGLPVGFAAGKQGAIRAAIAYTTASQRWLYFSDDQIRAAITEIATPAAANSLADDVAADVSTARTQLLRASGRIWWLVRPLAWRVDDFRDTKARVSVWTVTILSAAGVAAPQSEFVTVTLDLAWVDGDWRVDGVRDTPGPTPITGPHDQPWDAGPFDRALDGFTRIDAEPGS